MHDQEPESPVARKLRKLPPPRAPETLLPRVMAAARGRARAPWYRQPWVEWPLACQAASVAALAALAPFVPLALEWIGAGGVSRAAGDAAAEVGVVTGEVNTVARVLWRVFLEPTVGYLGPVIAIMCVAGAAFCAALTRVLKEGSVSR